MQRPISGVYWISEPKAGFPCRHALERGGEKVSNLIIRLRVPGEHVHTYSAYVELEIPAIEIPCVVTPEIAAGLGETGTTLLGLAVEEILQLVSLKNLMVR